MNEYPLTMATVPANTCYPPTIQPLLNLVAGYTTLNIPGNPQSYTVSDLAPIATNQGRLWFQTKQSVSGYGEPKVVRSYVNGEWREFAQLSQGDRILVSAEAVISPPWGEEGFTYSFPLDTGLPNYTPTAAPTPPDGLKYKTYIGYWDSKS